MESFFPFIREWTERVTIVIVTMLGISQIFLAEFLLYSFFLLRASISLGEKRRPHRCQTDGNTWR